MIRLALFIEGERVDLFENTSVVIKDKIKTADDIGTLFTQYTRPFKLPASKTNNKIFKHWYSPYTVESFDARKKHSAIITLNGSDYRKGYVKLIDAELKDNKIHAYNIQFFGELTTLKDRMGDDILSDINYFNQFNHEFSLTNVKNGFENGLNFNLLTSPPTITTSSDGQIIYPFISHTNGFQYNTIGGLSNLDTASPASPTDATDRLAKEDLKPAIRLTSILDGIESEYGISFEGDFLESDAFTELFLWCHRNKGGLTTDDPTTNQPSYTYKLQYFGNNVGFTKADADPVGYDVEVWNQVPGTGQPINSDWDKYIDYGSPLTGGNVPFDPDDIHDFIVYDVGFYPGEKITEYEVDLTINPDATFTAPYVVIVRNSYTDEIYHQELVTATNNFNGTIDIKANFNQKIKVDLEVIVVSSGLNEFDIDATITANRENGLAEQTRIWTYSDTVTSAQLITEAKVGFNLPKIKVIDFLRGLFKMFNLVAYAEQNLVTGQWKLFVEPYQEFLKNGRTFDITRYVDIESSKMERITPYSSLEFDFEEKKTFIALKTDELSKFDFGSLRWDANQYGQGDLLYDGGNYEVKVPFEKPVYERIVDSANDLTEIIYGWFVNDFSENEPEPELGAPLIFYRVQRDCSTDTIKWSDSSTTNTTYNAPSNVIADQSQTINFGAEIDEYTYEVNTNSLFANFYRDYIASSYAITARRYKVSAYLPYEFLHTYKLNDVLSINSQNYYMQEVSFDLMTGKAELDLLRIVPPNDEYSIAAQRPVSSTYTDYNYVDDGYWGSGYPVSSIPNQNITFLHHLAALTSASNYIGGSYYRQFNTLADVGMWSGTANWARIGTDSNTNYDSYVDAAVANVGGDFSMFLGIKVNPLVAENNGAILSLGKDLEKRRQWTLSKIGSTIRLLVFDNSTTIDDWEGYYYFESPSGFVTSTPSVIGVSYDQVSNSVLFHKDGLSYPADSETQVDVLSTFSARQNGDTDDLILRYYKNTTIPHGSNSPIVGTNLVLEQVQVYNEFLTSEQGSVIAEIMLSGDAIKNYI